MGRENVMRTGKVKRDIQKGIEEIDESKTPLQRTLDYLLQVENPCCFNMQGYQVELEWTNTEITLQNRLEEMFASL